MLKLIAALSTNRVIGRENGLPFRLRDDLRRFKEQTGKEAVFGGSNTYFSIPAQFRPLPGRENIVLTRHPNRFDGEGVTVVTSLDIVVERAQTENIWVIGGGEIYTLTLPFVTEMYLTRVHANIRGDTQFPEWNPEEWTLVSSEYRPADEKNEYPLTWEIHRRKP
nr:Dihydrofolate reductase [uncultured bacterium]